MIKKILTLLIAIVLNLSCFGQQNGKAYYYTKSNESTKANSNPDGSILIDSTEFVLTFNENFAKYELTVASNLNTEHKLSLIFSGYKGPYYFDFKKNDVYRTYKKYLIQKKADTFKWTLTKEKVELNGFTCFKATAEIEFQNRSRIIKRPVVAWYSPELNINAGPNGFSGLPGLIIQLEYRNNVTTLSKVKLYKSPLKVNIPKNSKILSEEDFDAMLKEIIHERDKN